MSDPLDLLMSGGAGAGSGVGLFLLGRAAMEWVRHRRPESMRATRVPSPPPPARCSDVVEEQVAEVHSIVARRDEDGASVLMRTLRETAENTRAMSTTLSEIRDSLRGPRPPMGSSPAE